MTTGRRQCDELHGLVRLMEDGAISADDVSRIDDLAQTDTTLLRSYVEYMQLVSDLRFGPTDHRIERMLAHVFGMDDLADEDKSGAESTCDVRDLSFSSQAAPLVLSSPAFPSTALPGLTAYFSSGWPVAYLIATVIFGVGALIGALVHVSHPQEFARERSPAVDNRVAHDRQAGSVGRITGMVDCRWEGAGDRGQGSDSGQWPVVSGQKASIDRQLTTSHYPLATISLGDTFALKSGLLEITYDTGAHVLLQGPVTYTVDSAAGGYLSIGKLTAKLEKRGQGTGDRGQSVTDGSRSASHGLLSTLHSPLSTAPNPSPLFAVRTPTAIVTDLGTEFGVVVDEKGHTFSHVISGTVEVQTVNRDKDGAVCQKVLLTESESVRIRTVNGVPTLERVAADTEQFILRLPKHRSIPLFNTGAGVGQGEPDPHWHIVAVSNKPDLVPGPAVVVSRIGGWTKTNPERSQWISMTSGWTRMPYGLATTYRTTFDLSSFRSETARISGWFLVDNYVSHIRLNGQEIVVPKHSTSTSYKNWTSFSIMRHFADGVNVLEIEVVNGDPNEDTPYPGGDQTGLRVELQGTALEKTAGAKRERN